MTIKSDGSGSASLKIELSKALREYFLNLEEVAGKTEMVKEDQVFDLKEIRKTFEDRPGVTVTQMATPTKNTLEVNLSYTSIEDVFTDNSFKTTGVVVFSEAAGVKTMKVHLDKQNYGRLAALFPVLSDPLFAGMGPQAGQSVSAAEYLKMIEFSLGSDGPAQLLKSNVVLTVKPEGEIVSQSGGTVSGDSVIFKVPLLRVLILDKPLDYSLAYK
jgi:hypothetical protein